jgi:hypothetical protein
MKKVLFKRSRSQKDYGLFDERVERLNKKLARLLGSNNHHHKPRIPNGIPKTNSVIFWLLIIVLSLFLWCSTGYYYLTDNQYGVILVNGRVHKVVKGMSLGITLPYPFGEMEIIDGNASSLLNLAGDGAPDNNYLGLTKDGVMAAVSAQFSYAVVNPYAFYLVGADVSNNLDEMVRLNLQIILHNYLVKNNYNDISHANLTILANTVKEQSDKKLAAFGVALVKLNVNKLSNGSVIAQNLDLNSNKLLANTILTGARNSAMSESTAESKSTSESNSDSVPKLKDSSLTKFDANGSTANDLAPSNQRSVNRDVVRQRNFDGM